MRRRGDGLDYIQTFDLLGEGSAPAQQHRSRHGLE